MAKPVPVPLQPLPRQGAEHWGRVHVEGDRRKPLPPPTAPRRN
ncbi:hypothetical protein ACKU27_12145 [Sphingobium yanoikuyae]